MTKFVGRRGTLGIVTEATRGTIPSLASAYWMPFAKMSFMDSTEIAAESQGLGVIADQDSQYVTFQFGAGSIDAQLYDTGLGYILESVLGAIDTPTGSNPTTHTYAISQTNQAKSVTLIWQDPDRCYVFPLAVVDSFKISVTPKGMVEYTVTFKSRKARDWTRLTPVFTSTGKKFLHQDLQVRLATTIGGLSGASETPLKNLELTISRNAINDELLGTVEPDDILSQELSVEGTLELNLTDDTYRNYMLNGTYSAMEIKFVHASDSSLQLQLPRVAFSQWQPDWSLNSIASQKINFKGNYDAANALDIISTCVLVNNKASY
jgi:hypothetical protein